jgi:HEPN domain-containing protein
MKKLTREWVAKAETDYEDALRLFRARNRTDFSNVCFHAQQSAEKYMKAVLVENGRSIQRIHDLPSLLTQLSSINPFWDTLREAAKELTVFAVRCRYPDGGIADRSTAKRSLLASKWIRTQMREALGLDGPRPRKRIGPKSQKSGK